MTRHEAAMAVLLVIVVWGLSTCVRASHSSNDPRIPDTMALQPMKDLKGWSKLCTTPVNILDPETKIWGDPVMKCVLIKTPNFYDPKKHMMCDAVGPEEDYIKCPKGISL